MMTSKQKKTTQVSAIEYSPAGLKLPVQVDRDTLMFHTTFAGTRYEDKDGDVLRKRVLEAIKVALNVQWLPVIRVRPLSHMGGVPDTAFGLEVERFYVALFPALDEQQHPHYKQVHWSAPLESRLEVSRPFEWGGSSSSFQTPWVGRRQGIPEYFLSYHDVAWEQLQLFLVWIRTIRQQFFEHLSTPEGIAALVMAYPPTEVFSLFTLPMELPEKR